MTRAQCNYRGALLLGVSFSALGFQAYAANPLSPAWIAAHTNAAQTGSLTGSIVSGTSAPQLQQTVQNMEKAAAALQAADNAQAALRTAASSTNPSDVTDGLSADGLVVGSGAWTNADAPVQTTSSTGRTEVTITQTSQQAILNWSNFNVGANTDLVFNQSAGGTSANTWVALNRVTSVTANPSQVLGTISAQGQVYIINPDGIIFGPHAQINVGALLASTADFYSTTGLTSDEDFLENGIYSTTAAGGGLNPAFQGAPVGSDITVDGGAQITTNSAISSVSSGGFVILMADQVSNAGTIMTPAGQTALAAGASFYLIPGYSPSGGGDAYSTTLGSEIAVADDGLTHVASNTGAIEATTGDVTMVGQTVDQSGVAYSTTTVDQRGTIHLLTDTGDTNDDVVLGPGSLTFIAPDINDPTTALDSQRAALIAQSATLNATRGVTTTNHQYLNDAANLADLLDESRIEITAGGSVDFAASSITMAQAGQIAVSAGTRDDVESGAILDVSGIPDVVLSAVENQLAVTLEPTQLRDSPLNADASYLKGDTVYVDINDLIYVAPSVTDPTARYYTPGGLVEVSGELADVGHTIGEWSASAGSITLSAPEVVAQSGSIFNVSGGSLDYQAGDILQSSLVSANGQVYDIDDAPASLLYTSLNGGFSVTNSKWGITQSFVSPVIGASEVYEDAYMVGRDAGTLTLSTPTALFNGTLVAATFTGANQNAAPSSSITDPYLQPQNAVPTGGQLDIGGYNSTGLVSVYATNVTIGSALSDADLIGLADPIPTGDEDTIVLSSSLLNSANLGGLSIATDGSVTINSALNLAPGGSVSIIAPTVDIAADITANAGTISITNELDSSDYLTTSSGADTSATIESGVTIDLSGLWTNLALAPDSGADLAYTNGGNLAIDMAGRINLDTGNVIDLDAGGGLSAKDALLNAKGGSLTLITNNVAAATGDDDPLVLDGTISAYGVGGGGGTLTLQAPSVAVGTDAVASGGGIALNPAFFQSGFSAYNINGVGGVTVAPGTDLAVLSPVYELNGNSTASVTGSSAANSLSLLVPDLFTANPAKATVTQRAGTSISLSAVADPTGVVLGGGEVSIGQGAAINVDPGQSIALDAYDIIDVEGDLTAPGGNITLTNNRVQNGGSQITSNYQDGLAIWIGSDAQLNVAGIAYTATDLDGRSFGTLYGGGTISLGGVANGPFADTDAQIIIRPGAVLDASGTSATIDQDAGWATDSSDPVLDATNGGTISLSSYTGIYNDGTLTAAAGGAGASGGTLAVSLESPIFDFTNVALDVPAYQLAPRELIINSNGGSGLDSDLAVGGATPEDLFGQAILGTDQIAAGGFSSLSLASRGLILFDGNVTLSASRAITLANGIIADGNASGSNAASSITIDAPVVTLDGTSPDLGSGTYTDELITNDWGAASTIGTGSFTVNADQIYLAKDLRFGVSSTILDGQGPGSDTSGSVLVDDVDYDAFSSLDFRSSGDIAFLSGTGTQDGHTTLWSQGDITLAAAQIYPASGVVAQVLAGFNFDGVSANAVATGTLTIARTTTTTPEEPYSVGGALTLVAGTIEQGGILVAPYGSITLGASGTANTYTRGAESNPVYTNLVQLLPGSITSVSMAGLTIPYGGTSDTFTYDYNGSAVSLASPSITLAGSSVDGEAGSTLDLSGGGTLQGGTGELVNGGSLESQGFVSGKVGSTDTLVTPLVSFSKGTIVAPTLATNPVYAIVKGYSGDYAPVTPLDSNANYYGSLPLLGEQITIPAGVPGLPAGTYTLLPSYYALLPGGYRVELAATAQVTPAAAANVTELANKTYLAAGTTGIANTTIASALETEMLITPAATVETYSQYDTEDYASFAIANAATLNTVRPLLPGDAGTLELNLSTNQGTDSALTFAGTANFAPASDDYDGGTLEVTSVNFNDVALGIDITGPDDSAASIGNNLAIAASQIDAFGAPRLIIGGRILYPSGSSTSPSFTILSDATMLNILSGADLTAADIFLTATANNGRGAINVDNGAVLDTIGQGASPFATIDGTVSYNTQQTSLLALSNGAITVQNLNSTDDQGPITVANGATLLSSGSITLSTDAASSIGDKVTFGASALNLDVGTAILGNAAALPSGTMLPGIDLTQSLITQLLTGDTADGAPALTSLTLSASGSVDFVGSVDLSTGGAGTGSGLSTLVINSPAIYGYGGTGAVAQLSTNTLVWNGLAAISASNPDSATSVLPTGIITGGAGSGSGTLDLIANTIVLGTATGATMLDDPTLNRVVAGFKTVNLIAADEIIGNNSGTLTADGTLNLETPLVTAAAGADTSITATKRLDLTNPSGTVASASLTNNLGGTLALAGRSITDDTAIATEAGSLSLTATKDLTLGSTAVIDASGPVSSLLSASVDNPGGSVILTSDNGSITTDAGSVIDVASTASSAGSVTISAANGSANIAGTLDAGSDTSVSDASAPGGNFTLNAGRVSNFDALQSLVQNGSFTGLQNYTLGTGDLTLDQEITAQTIDVTLNHGALEVATTLNASGRTVGAISLAATGNLTVEGTAVLDAHGTVERDDSYDNRIDSENTATISLTTSKGTLALDSGATLNVSAPTNAALPALGEISLFAPRTDNNTNIAITAAGPVNIEGAASIALYGSETYNEKTVDQALVNQIGAENRKFINAALANSNLTANTAGLAPYGAAFQIRPAVIIQSPGDITVNGDIDLANWRTAAQGGSTVAQPGYFTLRAGGNLNIYGSITDGFAAPLDGTGSNANPDDKGWVLYAGTEPYNQDVVVPGNVSLAAGTQFPTNTSRVLNYPITISGAIVSAQAVIPQDVTVTGRYVVPKGGMVATAAITTTSGTLYPAGSVIPAGTIFKSGTTFGAGSVVPWAMNLAPKTVWQAGSNLGLLSSGAGPLVTLASGSKLAAGDLIPAGTNVVLPNDATQVNLRKTTGGKQGKIWAVSDMLPAGSLSSSIALVSGADLKSSNQLAVQTQSQLAAHQTAGNMVLSDLHYSYASTGGTPAPAFSVIRTGTGDLNLISGGSIDEDSLYGIYTAGTQSAGVASSDELARGDAQEGINKILGGENSAHIYSFIASKSYQAWYPTDGGNVVVSAQGNISGDVLSDSNSFTTDTYYSDAVGNWLWRQGNATGTNSAWWINFGTYALSTDAETGQAGSNGSVYLTGFTGIGALGGGNVTLTAGGNAGNLNIVPGGTITDSGGLVVAVAGTGRVTSVTGTDSGTIAETGGGDLTVNVGGTIDPAFAGLTSTGTDSLGNLVYGTVTDLRGAVAINAGSIGNVITNGSHVEDGISIPDDAVFGGFTVALGDASLDIDTRGDLVLGDVIDPGMVVEQTTNPYTDASGESFDGGESAYFSLWQADTSVDLQSEGGDVVPVQAVPGSGGNNLIYPSTLIATAASGDILYATQSYASSGALGAGLELAPSANGQLELLAEGSIYANYNNIFDAPLDISMSGASTADLTNPFNPADLDVAYHKLAKSTSTVSTSTDPYASDSIGASGAASLFAFEFDTPTGDLHEADTQNALIYAATGDITDLAVGQIINFAPSSLPSIANTVETWYIAAKPFDIEAAGDIINAGNASLLPEVSADNPATFLTENLILNDRVSDLSLVSAGGNITDANFAIAGPGTLEISAGGNIYQGASGSLQSLGGIYDITAATNTNGASILVEAGMSNNSSASNGAAWSALATAYLTPSNVYNDEYPLSAAENKGKVVADYDAQLIIWLANIYGYNASSVSAALTYFYALPQNSQNLFLTQVYFDELTASGQEYNDTTSLRYKSYLRGQDAIATLFPGTSYSGSITLFGGSGITTSHGGAIEVLTPGGGLVLGLANTAPPAPVSPQPPAGLITFGSGDVDVFSSGTVYLGQSRVFTTDGGNITIWSQTGDIAAGSGSNTTQVYDPPQLTYDNYGDITLSPSNTTTGAGIATLTPLAGTAPGDVSLIAPEGTVDAGDAGIRASGNVVIAAAAVANTSNIKAGGSTSGTGAVAAPNIGSLSSASAASAGASSTANTDQNNNNAPREAPSIISVDVISYGTDSGSGGGDSDDTKKRRKGVA